MKSLKVDISSVLKKENGSYRTVDIVNHLTNNGYATNDTNKDNYDTSVGELNFNGFKAFYGEVDTIENIMYLKLEEENHV